MGFSFAYLKRVLPLAAVVWGAVFSAHAQRAAFRPGQPILFSSPGSDNATTNVPRLSTPSPVDFASPLQKSDLVFDFNNVPASAQQPRSTPPVFSPANNQRLRELLDQRNNWALLTPAEILGVKTPESFGQTSEWEADGRQRTKTAMERYLDRHSQAQTADTNGLQSDSSSPFVTFPGDWGNQPDVNFPMPINSGLDNAEQLLKRFLNAAPNNNTPSNPNPAANWPAQITTPQRPQPVQNPAQQVEMDRFRQLLTPVSSSAAVTTPSPGNTIFSPAQTRTDSHLGLPASSRVGASLPTLSSGIGMPLGLTPLPGITAPTNWQQAGVQPDWAPKPPPWLSQTPQPSAIPQRKF